MSLSTTKKSFLLRLQNRMSEMGMNQKELADNAGVAAKTISRWFNGQDSPQKANIIKVANALECSAEWLQDGTGPAKQDSIEVAGDKNITNMLKAGRDIAQADEKINYPSMHHQYAVELILKSDEETAKKVIAMLIKV